MNRKNYLLALLFWAIATSAVLAQWTKIAAPPVSSALSSIHFPTASVGYVGSDNGSIFKTSDGGASWKQVYKSGQLTGVELYFFGKIFFTDANRGVAVGQDGWGADFLIFRTTDGGASWTPIVEEAGFSGGENRAVDFPSANIGFVVGSSGKIFKTSNGGQNWSAIALPATDNLNDVDFVNDQTGFVASGSATKIYKTSNGGSTWQTLTTPDIFTEIKMPDVQNGFAHTTQNFYKTSDGGATWQQLSPPSDATSGLTRIQFLTANLGFTYFGGQFFKTENGGATWHLQQTAYNFPSADDFGGVDAFFMLDANRGWASGVQNIGGSVSGLVLSTANGGGVGLNLSLSANQFACPGANPQTASLSTTGGPTNFKWWVDSVQVAGGGASQTFNGPWSSGGHSIKVEVSKGSNIVSMENFFGVDVVASPVGSGSFLNPSVACFGTQVVFTANFAAPYLFQLVENGVVVDGPRAMDGNSNNWLRTPPISKTNSQFKIQYLHPCGVAVDVQNADIEGRPLPPLTLDVATPQPLLRCSDGNAATILVHNTTAGHSFLLFQNGQSVGNYVYSGSGGTVEMYAKTFDSTSAFSVQAISDWGCKVFLNEKLTVQVERPDARFGSGGINFPIGTAVSVNFEGKEANNFQWNFGAGATPATSTLKNPPVVNYSVATTKSNIRLIVTAPLGCRDTVLRPVGFFNASNLSQFWAQEMEFAGKQGYTYGQNISIDNQGNIFLDGATTAGDDGKALITSRAGATLDLPDAVEAISKYSPQGVLLWNLAVESPGAKISDVEAAPDGSLIASFWTNTNHLNIPAVDEKRLIFNDLKGAALVKYDAGGRIKWAARVQACNSDGVPSIFDIETDAEGNFYILGYYGGHFGSACHSFLNADGSVFAEFTVAVHFLAKLDPAGQFVWAKSLDAAGGFSVYATALKVDAAGNLFISGEGTTVLEKLDTQGNLLWSVKNQSGMFDLMTTRSLDLDPSGNVYVSGAFRENIVFQGLPALTGGAAQHGSDFDLFVLKISELGVPLWLKGGFTQDWEHSAVQYFDGKIFVYGAFARANFKMDNLQFDGPAWRNLLLLQLSVADGTPQKHLLVGENNPADPSQLGSYHDRQGRCLAVNSQGHLHFLGRNGYQIKLTNTILSQLDWLFLAKINSDFTSSQQQVADVSIDAAVSPNPSDGSAAWLRFDLPVAMDLSFRLSGAGGRTVGQLEKRQFSAGAAAFDLRELAADGLPAGIYFLEILTENRILERLKWVKF